MGISSMIKLLVKLEIPSPQALGCSQLFPSSAAHSVTVVEMRRPRFGQNRRREVLQHVVVSPSAKGRGQRPNQISALRACR